MDKVFSKHQNSPKKENSKMANSLKELSPLKMVQFMKEVWKMGKKLVKDHLKKQMVVFMKVILKMTNFMDKES